MDDNQASSDALQTSSRVPSGRLSRFLQLGATAGQMAASGAREKVRRIAQRAEQELPHVLLTADNARLLAARLARLRGAAMKVGQMLSLEGDNMLPKEFADALHILRSSAHTMPKKQVHEVLTREFGSSWRRRFSEFDEKPIAAASIGQVHRAVTLQGEEVVLKIQYPGVAESIESDVDNLRSLLSMARLVPGGVDVDALVTEVKRELRQEVDYQRELNQLTAYREKVGDDPDYRLPRAFPELSTSHVLTMERVPGRPLLDWASGASDAERQRVAGLLLQLMLREFFVFGLSQTDPNPANYFFDADGQRLVLLDFGAARTVPEHVATIYREAFIGLANRDRERLRSVLGQLGIDEHAPAEAREIILNMALEVAEAFDTDIYDFAASDLQERLTSMGKDLRKFHGQLKPPPPEYIFFQRKLGGTFLICRQLRARVSCRDALIQSGLLSEVAPPGAAVGL